MDQVLEGRIFKCIFTAAVISVFAAGFTCLGVQEHRYRSSIESRFDSYADRRGNNDGIVSIDEKIDFVESFTDHKPNRLGIKIDDFTFRYKELTVNEYEASRTQTQ